MSETNGPLKYRCLFNDNLFEEQRKELEELRTDMNNVSAVVENLDTHLAHLHTLDSIKSSLEVITSTLLNVATGKAQIPLDVAQELWKQNAKDRTSNVKVYNTIILGLVGIIVFLLVGEHFGWVHKLFGAP